MLSNFHKGVLRNSFKKPRQNQMHKKQKHTFLLLGASCLESGWSTIPHLFFAEDCFKHLEESVKLEEK